MCGGRGGRRISLAVALLLCSAVAAAEGAGTLRAELAGPFHESVQEDVAVSGAIVVGVAAPAALSGPATLGGLMVPMVGEQICMTVLSRDGVYYSRNDYRVPGASDAVASSFVLVPYEGTQQRELIGSYGEGELAIRVTPGSCAQDPGKFLVPSRASEYQAVDLLINAFGANAVYFRTADGTEADCVEFTQGRRTSYDYRCSIPVTALDTDSRVVIVERERYGRPLGEVEVELQLHSGR